MRSVVQRVSRAAVRVDGRIVGEIGAGLLVLLGIAAGDGPADAEALAGKVARLRIFANEEGRFDRSLLDTGVAALVVSQFTLIAEYRSRTEPAAREFAPGWKGNRPSFSAAARPEVAEPLCDCFVDALRALGVSVETGVFGAKMEVELVNDGPVTLIIDV